LSTRAGISRSIVVGVIIVIIAVSGSLYAFYSISTQTTSTSTISTQQLQTVVFGFSGAPDVTDTPGFEMWEAIAPTLGLNLQVQYMDGDTSVAQAIAAGSIQVGEGSFQAPVQADEVSGNSSGSFPFVVFAPYENVQDYSFVVPNAITNFSQMAGKPIDVFATTSASGLICKFLLTLHNIPSNEQDCVPVGSGQQTFYSALISGTAQGGLLEPFYTVSALETGRFHILTNIPTTWPNVIFSVLYTSRTYAAAHPDVLLKIEEAIVLAHRWAYNETAWIQRWSTDFPGSGTPATAGAAWKIFLSMGIWNPNSGLTNTAFLYSESFWHNASQLNYILAPKYWADISYQTQALSALGSYTGPATGYVDPQIPSLNITITPSSAVVNGGEQAWLAYQPQSIPPAAMNGGQAAMVATENGLRRGIL
jgi:hypothetical protein